MAQKRARVDEIDAISQDPDFWNDADRAQGLMRERGELVETIESVEGLQSKIADSGVLLEMAAEEGLSEEDVAEEVGGVLTEIEGVARGPRDAAHAQR